MQQVHRCATLCDHLALKPLCKICEAFFLLTRQLLNSNLLNNYFFVMTITLSHYILRELFKEVYDLRFLFLFGFSLFFFPINECYLT